MVPVANSAENGGEIIIYAQDCCMNDRYIIFHCTNSFSLGNWCRALHLGTFFFFDRLLSDWRREEVATALCSWSLQC